MALCRPHFPGSSGILVVNDPFTLTLRFLLPFPSFRREGIEWWNHKTFRDPKNHTWLANNLPQDTRIDSTQLSKKLLDHARLRRSVALPSLIMLDSAGASPSRA